jgi:Undecaprenyl-phosphate galactose phosphotransferase WbaP
MLAEAIGVTARQDQYLSIALLVAAFLWFGLYTGCGPSPYERFRLRVSGIVVFVIVDLLLRYRLEAASTLAVGALVAAPLLLFGHYVEAMLRTLLIRFELWGAPAVIVGCRHEGGRLAQILLNQPAFGLRPVGFVVAPRDSASESTSVPLPLIAPKTDPRAVPRPFEFVVFLSPEELSEQTSDPNSWISGCRHLLVEGVGDLQSLWLRTRTLGGAIGIEMRCDLRRRHNQMLKRAIDVVLAGATALLVLPIIAILAVAIKLVDPGPAFYVQIRVGRNMSALRMLKLRSMYVNAERCLEEHLRQDPSARAEWSRFYKLSRDPRVLPIIGNLMRRASLDELPQLWHVIRGDMSLVGPRPFPPYHLESFDTAFRVVRASVKPGITGMWQVSSRSNGDVDVQKAQDLFYIRNWSIWLDIFILLQTLPALLWGRGAR